MTEPLFHSAPPRTWKPLPEQFKHVGREGIKSCREQLAKSKESK